VNQQKLNSQTEKTLHDGYSMIVQNSMLWNYSCSNAGQKIFYELSFWVVQGSTFEAIKRRISFQNPHGRNANDYPRSFEQVFKGFGGHRVVDVLIRYFPNPSLKET
jgi:hypothetical protein